MTARALAIRTRDVVWACAAEAGVARPFAAALLVLLVLAGPARASLAPADLDAVGLSPAPGAAVPAELVFAEADGRERRLGDLLGRRPLVLVLADYDCRELCGPILSVVGHAVSGTGLEPGRDLDLVAIGINPRATGRDAARLGADALAPDVVHAAHLLTGAPASTAALARAIGYRARYDAEAGRFAHPADILVLTPEGRVSRVLPGLALDPAVLRLALVEAGEGRVGTLGDRLHLLCYGLDPARGLSDRAILVALPIGGALTLAGLAAFLLRLVRREPAGAAR